ncbi:MAG: MOSC N-terminal beta barrel domain-containing protein [Candidatus Saccharimonadales bacterium]
MVTVAEVSLAYGKSMRAVENPQVLSFDSNGLFGDRQYMFVEAEPYILKNPSYRPGREVGPGTFLSMREDPQMTALIPVLEKDGLRISWADQDAIFVPKAEDVDTNRIPVSIHRWRGEAVDQGKVASEWGSNYLGRPVCLVEVSNERPRFVENDPSLGRVGFADGFAVTVGSTTAFNAINKALQSRGRQPIGASRTRTTVVLEGLEVEGEQFPEDFIDEIKVTSNGLTLILKRWKPCSRCEIPDTDEITGERDRRSTYIRPMLGKLGRTGKFLDTVKYGSKSEIFLTENFVVIVPEEMPLDATIDLRKGSELEVTYTDSTNWVRQ